MCSACQYVYVVITNYSPGPLQSLQSTIQYAPMMQPQLSAYTAMAAAAAAASPVPTLATTPSSMTTPTMSPISYDKMILPNNFKCEIF